jgi:preprotein translocase subunit SecY
MIESLVASFRIPDLRAKLLFTFAMLVAFRFMAHIPVPGVDFEGLRNLFATNQLLGMLNLFSGGGMRQFSIVAMGVYPYITATIIMQLLIPVIPQLEALSKEGESGRAKLNQYMHWATVPLAALQAFGTIQFINNGTAQTSSSGRDIISHFDLGLYPIETLAIVATMVAGTMLLVWIGELITQNGVGNGVSIIIFAGIVASLPQVIVQAIAGQISLIPLLAFAVVGIGIVVGIVLVYEGQRRIPVQYARRLRGSRWYGGGSTHIPMRVNSAGMIPLIFASSLMIFPGTLASYFVGADNQLIRDVANTAYNTFYVGTSWIYWGLYFVMVVGFTFFYTLVIFQQQNIGENLQKNGAFIPGIRPGRPTADYLYKVLIRITWAGAVFLGIVAVTPFFLQQFTSVQALTLSSTGLLIVVGVVLDTIKQLEAQLLMRNYRGFIR